VRHPPRPRPGCRLPESTSAGASPAPTPARAPDGTRLDRSFGELDRAHQPAPGSSARRFRRQRRSLLLALSRTSTAWKSSGTPRPEGNRDTCLPTFAYKERVRILLQCSTTVEMGTRV